MMDRRDALKLTAVLGVTALTMRGGPALALEEAPDQDDKVLTEAQSGDPATPAETLTYNPIDVQRAIVGQKKAAFVPRITDIRSDLVAGAVTHIGKSRTNNRVEITKWFDVFDLPFDLDGKPLPFCATGLSYVAASLYARKDGKTMLDTQTLRNYLGDVDHHHFYPTPSVLDMKLVAQGKRRWISRAQATGQLAPRAGWLVVYDWNGDGHPDHVGLVESLQGTDLHTIEFNTSDANATNGGAVARKIRPLGKRIQGFIRPELVRAA